jgi:hypothetical protein
MQLDMECKWDGGKITTKQRIYFMYKPKKLFSMPEEEIQRFQEIAADAAHIGPKSIEQIKEIHCQYPASLYATFIYCQTLQLFEDFEEADKIIEHMQTRFKDEILTRCLIAEEWLKQRKYQEFRNVFDKIEVLGAACPQRKSFFFEEALFFHHLWARHYFETKNQFHFEKHAEVIQMLMDTYQMASQDLSDEELNVISENRLGG